MAQNGMFRNAFRGFNKQDVLQYIDEITAAWDTERKDLESGRNDAVAAQEALQVTADEAQAAAAAATEQLVAVEAQLTDTQQKLENTTADLSVAATTIEEMAIQLEEAQRRLADLEREIITVANERDDAIAALADAKEQLAQNESTARQLEDSRQQVGRQNEQIAEMRQTIDRYETAVGNADTMHQRVAGIARPYMEQVGRQAQETLDTVQSNLNALLAQLSSLQEGVEQSRRALQDSTANSNNHLNAALNDWLNAAKNIGGQNRHFFQ